MVLFLETVPIKTHVMDQRKKGTNERLHFYIYLINQDDWLLIHIIIVQEGKGPAPAPDPKITKRIRAESPDSHNLFRIRSPAF